MLTRHGAVPHFTVETITGATIDYSRIWQQQHLVLITLRDARASDAAQYAADIDERLRAVRSDTALVVTQHAVDGLPAPGVLIADRWGEIAHVVHADDVAGLPPAQDVFEWVEHVRQRCPECEGETR